MGYYSDVALTLRKEDALELIKQAKENEKVWPYMYMAYIADQNEYVTFYWEWIKWYDDYEGIQFITAFYRNLAEYSFKRIGEDNSDIEEEWNGDDDNIVYKVQIKRHFNIESSEQKTTKWITADAAIRIANKRAEGE